MSHTTMVGDDEWLVVSRDTDWVNSEIIIATKAWVELSEMR